MIVTLDGVIQEPGFAYTINSGSITFSQPPLAGVTFYGKEFKFKDDISLFPLESKKNW